MKVSKYDSWLLYGAINFKSFCMFIYYWLEIFVLHKQGNADSGYQLQQFT